MSIGPADVAIFVAYLVAVLAPGLYASRRSVATKRDYYNAANQFIVQRTLAAKNEWRARMGVVFTDYLQFVMPFVYLAPGIVAPLLFPQAPEAVCPCRT